jgi:Putative Ig domain
MTRKGLGLVATGGLVTLLCGASPASAQAVAPSLGTAAPYTVLGTNTIPTVGTVTCTNTGPGSAINGNVGSTFTSITNTLCTITGSIDAPVAGSVVTDFNAAFAAVDTLNPVCTGVIPTVTTTLAPGVYCSAAGTTIGAGVILTLNGTASDVWVFRVGTGGPGALTLTSAQVVMGGSALACNSYWKTSAGATVTDSKFNGTVLSGAGVTMTRGSWFGRALAKTDATVTDAAPLTFAGCSAAIVPLLPPTVTKAFSPASITAGGVSRLTITVSNANAAAIALTAALTDTLPSGVLVAPTPNPTTTCGGAVTATAGGSTVTLATGSTIPAGSCTIAVNVTAAAAGSFVNTIPAGALQTNSGNNAAPATAPLAAGPVITLAPATLPNGTVGVPFSQTLTGSGGTAPFSFSVTAGALPAGVTLTPAGTLGLLSGTPTAPGTSTFTIRVTDVGGFFAERSFTMVVATGVPTLPQAFVLLLALGLIAVGYFRLRRRARAE